MSPRSQDVLWVRRSRRPKIQVANLDRGMQVLTMPKQANRSSRKMISKGDLPSKVCIACARPFAWRKKWARDWDEVKYCSDRCRSVRPGNHDQ
jgi:hypothetical protein